MRIPGTTKKDKFGCAVALGQGCYLIKLLLVEWHMPPFIATLNLHEYPQNEKYYSE